MNFPNFTCLIADDERHSREYLRDLLTEFMDGINIQEAANGKQALDYLINNEVNLLFLDISMPDMSGLKVLQQITHRTFKTVFITAYSQYSIDALREGAVDYLLKPIKKSEFKEMLERVIKKIAEEPSSLINDIERSPIKQLLVTHQNGMRLLPLRDIIYFKADNTYTTIFLNNGQKLITSKPLSQYELMLTQDHFFRIHKSYIVNLLQLKATHHKQGLEVIMSNDVHLPLSRYRHAEFIKRIKSNPDTLQI